MESTKEEWLVKYRNRKLLKPTKGAPIVLVSFVCDEKVNFFFSRSQKLRERMLEIDKRHENGIDQSMVHPFG